MTTRMTPLKTDRLLIRELTAADLQSVHRVLCNAWGVPDREREAGVEAREQWLH
ncbi:MAG: hypothetical protein NVSMB52_08870 [Chloroflexota bacterium]